MSLSALYKKLQSLNSKDFNNLPRKESGDMESLKTIDENIQLESIHGIDINSISKYVKNDYDVITGAYSDIIDTNIKLGIGDGLLKIYNKIDSDSGFAYSKVAEKILPYFIITKDKIINFDYEIGVQYTVEYMVYNHKLELQTKGNNDCVSHFAFLQKFELTPESVIGPNVVNRYAYDDISKKSVLRYTNVTNAIMYIPIPDYTGYSYAKYDIRDPKGVKYSKKIDLIDNKPFDINKLPDSITVGPNVGTSYIDSDISFGDINFYLYRRGNSYGTDNFIIRLIGNGLNTKCNKYYITQLSNSVIDCKMYSISKGVHIIKKSSDELTIFKDPPVLDTKVSVETIDYKFSDSIVSYKLIFGTILIVITKKTIELIGINTSPLHFKKIKSVNIDTPSCATIANNYILLYNNNKKKILIYDNLLNYNDIIEDDIINYHVYNMFSFSNNSIIIAYKNNNDHILMVIKDNNKFKLSSCKWIESTTGYEDTKVHTHYVKKNKNASIFKLRFTNLSFELFFDRQEKSIKIENPNRFLKGDVYKSYNLYIGSVNGTNYLYHDTMNQDYIGYGSKEYYKNFNEYIIDYLKNNDKIIIFSEFINTIGNKELFGNIHSDSGRYGIYYIDNKFIVVNDYGDIDICKTMQYSHTSCPIILKDKKIYSINRSLGLILAEKNKIFYLIDLNSFEILKQIPNSLTYGSEVQQAIKLSDNLVVINGGEALDIQNSKTFKYLSNMTNQSVALNENILFYKSLYRSVGKNKSELLNVYDKDDFSRIASFSDNKNLNCDYDNRVSSFVKDYYKIVQL